MHVEGKVDDLVKDLEHKDIIVKTSSPWNFPIVVVPKKNGNIRMCVDYRQLNAATERPVYYSSHMLPVSNSSIVSKDQDIFHL